MLRNCEIWCHCLADSIDRMLNRLCSVPALPVGLHRRGRSSCGSSRTFPLQLFPHPSPTSISLSFILGSATPHRQIPYRFFLSSAVHHAGMSVRVYCSGTRIDSSIAAILRAQNQINPARVVAFSSTLHVETHEI